MIRLEAYVLVTTQFSEDVSVIVSAPWMNFTIQDTVTRQQTTIISFPAGIVRPTTDLSNCVNCGQSVRLVIVEAAYPVIVHGYLTTGSSVDGFLILPVDVLGSEYIVVSHTNVRGYFGGELIVSAIEDNTNVKISVSDVKQLTIILQKYQSYHHKNFDLTGVLITADKPVSVMSSMDSAKVPYLAKGFDFLIEHLPPTKGLGVRYILAPFLGRRSGFFFRVVAIPPSPTQVTVSDGAIITLQPGNTSKGRATK